MSEPQTKHPKHNEKDKAGDLTDYKMITTRDKLKHI